MNDYDDANHYHAMFYADDYAEERLCQQAHEEFQAVQQEREAAWWAWSIDQQEA